MNYKAPRGTHDLVGAEARKLRFLENIARAVFERWNYSEICLPSFEDSGLFTRSIGESTDIVEKEMYVFEDRKGRKLALRPEGTASVVRALLEHNLLQTLPVAKLFYAGSMFRYERPQAGRYREFYQVGAEFFGNPEPEADAEAIIIAGEILKSAGLTKTDIHINTLGCKACRPAFRAELKNHFSSKTDLCEDCNKRLEHNPLRLLDCKIDGPKFAGLPKMEDFLCAECKVHFETVKGLLEKAGCAFSVDHRLVRGLDYYTKTIFEIRSQSVGSQDAICAGGRYDDLVKELGGSPTPAVGFALGSERVIMAATNENAKWEPKTLVKVFIAVNEIGGHKDAFSRAVELKNSKASDPIRKVLELDKVEVLVEGPFSKRSLKSQLNLANRFGADQTIIFFNAKDENKCDVVQVRDMKTQQQKEIHL